MRPRPTSRRAGLTRTTAILVFVAFSALWACAASALLARLLVEETYDRSARTRCANHLRLLALAARQYADDHRALPQVGARPSSELAGGVDSNASTKVVRALVWAAYHDDPERFVCPSSLDQAVPITDAETRTDLRRWFWDGRSIGDRTRSPLVDDLPDPVLDETRELSYGWVRRALPLDPPAATPLAADRAQADPALRERAAAAAAPGPTATTPTARTWRVPTAASSGSRPA